MTREGHAGDGSGSGSCSTLVNFYDAGPLSLPHSLAVVHPITSSSTQAWGRGVHLKSYTCNFHCPWQGHTRTCGKF